MSKKLAQVAMRTCLLYAFFAGMWILLSDKVLVAIFSDHEIVDRIQTYKGLLFVTVTALLLYITVRGQLLLWEREARARKSAETELQLFRSLIDHSTDGILVVDPKTGSILDTNQTACRQCNLSREEMIGRRAIDLTVLTDDFSWDAHIDKIRSAGSLVLERQFKRRDGSEFPVEVSVTYVTTEQGDRLISILRDITERKHSEAEKKLLETQLAQAQKMEAIGQLSGGIAHDFNNILAAIIGNVELAQQDIGPNHPALGWLKGILKATTRAKNLVQQILAFARQQKQEHSVIKLEKVVEESVRLLRATLPAGVELESSIAKGAPNVQADATQVQQVILNIVTNAWQAMEGKPGRITIELGEANVDDDFSRGQADLRPGHYARLSIADTGKGMDDETVKRVFDPFFTTKGPGQGTGLGLSVVHGIMKSHQGAVTVSSQVGKGTTFHLYFPAVNASATNSDTAEFKLPKGSGQKILFLDDESTLVMVGSKMLRRLGYEATAFTKPEDALKAFSDNPRQYDLVITDLNMPVMSGLDVAAEFLKLRPDIPILLSSGHITEDLKAKARQVGIKHILYKPNTLAEMSETIHRLVTGTNNES